MTIEARSSTRANQLWSVRARAAERDTRQLSSPPPALVDAYGLLDHRTRESTVPQDAAPPGRYLAIEDGDRRRLISLTRPITHIGRGLIADVRLEDRILDDRSSGGTFVNGEEVTVANLHDGDIVRVGRVVFRFTEIAPTLKRDGALRRIPLRAGRPRRARAAAAS